MKSDLTYPGDNRGDAVCEIAIFDDRCVVRGRTGATAEGKPRQVSEMLREMEVFKSNPD